MIFIFSISWLICLAYISWISLLFVSWIKPKNTNIKNDDNPIGISIVIAIRNESENLPLLLKSIAQLDYPHHLFELIFIDDHSEDNSKEIIKTFIKYHPQITLKLLALKDDVFGKKAALYEAYKKTNHDIIITTDGDVELPTKWLTITSKAFQNPKILMILGGVKVNYSSSFIGDFQALELLSLIASGAGASGLNQPIMSNGANISFRKNILTKINKNVLKPSIPSGDDMFLMLETKRRFGAKSIMFLKDSSHFIHTSPINHWNELINQRTRWVSKSRHYKDPFLIATSWIVFLQNLLLPVLAILSIPLPEVLQILWPIWLIKVLIDYVFLFNASKFTSQKYLMKNYFLMAFIYPFFISYTAIIGQFSSFNWKGRNY